jgi:hypothetical protein
VVSHRSRQHVVGGGGVGLNDAAAARHLVGTARDKT